MRTRQLINAPRHGDIAQVFAVKLEHRPLTCQTLAGTYHATLSLNHLPLNMMNIIHTV